MEHGKPGDSFPQWIKGRKHWKMKDCLRRVGICNMEALSNLDLKRLRGHRPRRKQVKGEVSYYEQLKKFCKWGGQRDTDWGCRDLSKQGDFPLFLKISALQLFRHCLPAAICHNKAIKMHSLKDVRFASCLSVCFSVSEQAAALALEMTGHLIYRARQLLKGTHKSWL